MDQQKERIFKLLSDDDVTTLVLVGESGIGKTWMARQISDRAMCQGLFNITFWLFLPEQHDDLALYTNIAHQLSLLPSIDEEWEDNNDDNQEVETEKKEERLETLKPKISAMLKGKRCLLILDDVKVNEEKIKSGFKGLLPPNKQNSCCKVLITTKTKGDPTDNIIKVGTKRVENIEPFSEEDSLQFLRERAEIPDSGSQYIESLLFSIARSSKGLPGALIIIAEALKSYLQEQDLGVSTLETTLEEVVNYGSMPDLLRIGYDMLPRSGVITDCCWHSRQFFRICGSSVRFNELITYWIMEGCLGPVDGIEKAYRKGHDTLMKLVERGMLKTQEDNTVVMEGALLAMDDRRRHGFGGTAKLGLANVFGDEKWEGLKIIRRMDGMTKTLFNCKKWQKVSALLLNGSHLYGELPQSFNQHMKGLRVLSLFNPRFKSLPSFLSTMTSLVVLVLRGCHMLQEIDGIRDLKALVVLEISGARSLEEISYDLFEKIPNLRSLNLSEAQFVSLPSSLFQLTELRWLILRSCSRLEKLPSLEALKELEVLDVSGATSLNDIRTFKELQKLQALDASQTQLRGLPFLFFLKNLTQLSLSNCSHLKTLPRLDQLTSLKILDIAGAPVLKQIHPSNSSFLYDLNLRGCSILVELPHTTATKHLETIDLSDAFSLENIKDPSFEHLKYLRLLNLSNTKVEDVPSLSNLGNLRRLLLVGCSLLTTLPEMEGLPRLEVFHISGATKLKKIETRHLNHANLRQILLKGCSSLVELPHLTALEKLEVLDLSGCIALEIIEGQEKAFDHMTRLSRLNLSETKIECLPSLSSLSSLCHLLLRNCTKLKKLPLPVSLLKLEELDLCGSFSLTEIQTESLEHLIDLQSLDLSRTALVYLPSFSNLVKIRKLSLGSCSNLNTVPNLETLVKLEVLDLSGTAVALGCLESLKSPSILRVLRLRDCSSILELPICLESHKCLEILDLFGTSIKEFPYGISKLNHLKHLDLPNLQDIKVDWGEVGWLPEELNWEECGVPKFAEIPTVSSKPSINVSDNKIFQLLKKNPKLQERCFEQFHFVVCSKGHDEEDIDSHRNESVVRDIYSHTRHLSYPKEHRRSLEIRGFPALPDGIEVVLSCAEFISLIEIDFIITGLSDLGAENVKNTKGCWIERCNEAKSILCEEEEHVISGKSLETLWVSNMTNLEGVYSGNVHSRSFKNLKSLYLDCCPKLDNVFSLSQVPENLEILHIKFCPLLVNIFSSSQVPERLKILHVKFCDELETLFEQNTSVVSESNLRTLHLWGLPQLKSIGRVLPFLQAPDIRECPKLSGDAPTL